MNETCAGRVRRSLGIAIPVLTAMMLAATAAGAADRQGVPGSADVMSASHPGPLTLDDCTLIALRNSPQIISSAQSVTSARAALTRARSSYYPQVSLGAVEAIGESGSDDAERTEQLDLSLRQTLWRSGLRESVEESATRLRSAEFNHETMVQSLVEQVASDYYRVLASERLTQVAEAGVESAKGHLEQVQARIELGAAPEVDAFTAEDDLARAELDLIDARTNEQISLSRLRTTMGVPVETRLKLAPPSLPPSDELPALAQALATARENRPEVLAATEGVAGGRSALAQARIGRGPITELGGRYDRGYVDWSGREPSWDLSLSLSWPILDGEATAAEVISARAALARSEADLQQTLNQVALEVETALAEVERARARIAVSARSVAAAQARLNAAEGKYQEGVGILLEVTDARAALTGALANQIQAEYDYRTALISVRRAVGTLSPPTAEP